MITMIVHVRVRPENVLAYEALMTHVVAMVREHEPGVPYYAFARSVEDPDTYVVVETYQDPEVHAAHMASDWVRESLPKVARLIEGTPDIKQYVSPGSESVRHRKEDSSHD